VISVLNQIIDSYERKARLYPALVLIAPAVAMAFAIMLPTLSTIESIVGLIIAGGGAWLLSQLARDEGKKGEPKLFEKWGGTPSVAIFRHRDSRIDPITKERYHKKLTGLVKEVNAPSPADEAAAPEEADNVYRAWSTYVRVNTRDTKKYPLLFQENVCYGYRRNLGGLRPIGITISALCALGGLGWLAHQAYSGNRLSEAVMGAAVLALVFLVLWIFRFTPDWVRIPADAYAERLAEAVDGLHGKTASKK
jgi:hypothetical protein